MKLFKKNRFSILLFISFVLVDVVIYWNIWNTFFQQDEWSLFGRAIFQSTNLPYSLFNFSGAHFHPLGSLIWLVLYKLLGFNGAYFAALSILMHSLTAVISYYFFQIFTKNKKVSMLLSLLFLVSFPTKQVVVWFAASPYLIPCAALIMAFFILVSRINFEKDLSLKNLLILIAIFVSAFLIREEAVVILILFPLYLKLFKNYSFKLRLSDKITSFIVIGVLLVLSRFLFESALGEKVVYEQGNVNVMRLYNFSLVPVKMFVQNIIELEQIWDISRIYSRVGFPRITDGVIVETAIYEHVVVFLLIPFLILYSLIFFRMRLNEKRILLFSIVLIVSISFVVGFQSRRLYFLESRYLYLTSIGVLLMLYCFFKTIWVEKIVNRSKVIYIVVGLSTLFIVYSFLNIQRIMNDVYLPYAKTRKDIIKQVLNYYPTIPNRVVFYVECRDKEDCLSDGSVLPFQSGFGQMLIVIYGSKNERAYAPFLSDFYLWDPQKEDYKVMGNYGFGYYHNLENFEEFLKEGKVLPSEIIAFSYDRSENKVQDISTRIRKQLVGELSTPN